MPTSSTEFACQAGKVTASGLSRTKSPLRRISARQPARVFRRARTRVAYPSARTKVPRKWRVLFAWLGAFLNRRNNSSSRGSRMRVPVADTASRNAVTKAGSIPYSRDPGNLTSQSAPAAKAPCSYLYQNKTYPRAVLPGTENISSNQQRTTVLGIYRFFLEVRGNCKLSLLLYLRDPNERRSCNQGCYDCQSRICRLILTL